MEKETKLSKLVVVDSSVFIDYLRNYPKGLDFIKSIPKENRENFLFSAITETELIAGKSCDKEDVRTTVLGMLSQFTKVEVDNPVALKAGDLCRKYNTQLPDSIIAATAIINNAELLTKNISDFKGIKDLKVRKPY